MMSKPATHRSTASARTSGGSAKAPVTASHAPTGETESARPRKKWLKEVKPDEDGIITMRPGRFYLADLKQYTKLPRDLAMHIEGKSSLARLGLAVHLTAPHAHAGWHGRLTLEMYNFGPFNLELKAGVPIGQITFWRVEDPPAVVASKTFTGQEKASGSTG